MDSKQWKQWARDQLTYIAANSRNDIRPIGQNILEYLGKRPFTKDELVALHMAMLGWDTGVFDNACLEAIQDHWIHKAATPEEVDDYWLGVKTNEKT